MCQTATTMAASLAIGYFTSTSGLASFRSYPFVQGAQPVVFFSCSPRRYPCRLIESSLSQRETTEGQSSEVAFQHREEIADIGQHFHLVAQKNEDENCVYQDWHAEVPLAQPREEKEEVHQYQDDVYQENPVVYLFGEVKSYQSYEQTQSNHVPCESTFAYSMIETQDGSCLYNTPKRRSAERSQELVERKLLLRITSLTNNF